MERRLPIFELTLEAPYEGSRTSNMLLPYDIAARRARNAVAEFPSDLEDLWKIKMRPEERYIYVASLAFNCCRFWAVSSPTSYP